MARLPRNPLDPKVATPIVTTPTTNISPNMAPATISPNMTPRPRNGIASTLGRGNRQERVDIDASRIMNQDSLLMQTAATKGRQAGNQRGLLNSSMASGAGIRAALDYVTPMASQNMAQAHNSNRADQDYNINRDLQRRGQAFDLERLQTQGQIARDLSRQEYGQSRGLSRQQFQNARSLSEQAFQQQFGLSRAQYEFELERQARGFGQERFLTQTQFQNASALSEQAFQQQFGLSRAQYEFELERQERAITADANMQATEYTFRDRQTQLDREQARLLASWNLQGQDRQAAQGMLVSVHGMNNNALQAIMANPNLTAAERISQIAAAQRQLMAQTAMIEGLFSMNVVWSQPTGSSGTGGSSGQPTEIINQGGGPRRQPLGQISDR